MPKDLLETELNYPPLNMSMQPRDLLEGQPFKTYNEQINDNISSDYGFTDDDKLIIGSIFTPEELDEIRKSKPMGLLEGIKKKGVWESVKEQGKEFWSQFKPVEAWQSVGKTMVDWKAAKEASEAKPDNETDEERRKRFEEVQKVMPNVKWEDFIKVKTNSVPNETYLREMLRDSYRDQIRGTTVSGMVGNILGEMPVFMAELYASGGAVSALKTGLKKAAPAMVKNIAEQTAKIAAKGKVANAAVKTTSLAGKASVMAAVSPTMLTKNYLDRKISGTIKATDKGNILLAEMDEKPYTTAAKSFMDTQVSIFSEQTGEAIVGAVGNAVKKVTSPVIAKFMASPKVAQARDAILREIRKFKPDLDMQKFMHDKLYYNGVLGEMSEERLEGVLRGVLQLNTDDERSTTDQILDALYPSKDQLLAELGAFTISGSLPYASRAVKNMLSKKGLSEAQINEVLENKDQTEIDSIADELTTQERNAQFEETKRMNPDAADVTQYVFDTLNNAGISEKEATQAARVVTGYALAGAKATGMTPMEFFRQRFPKVQREQFADFQKQFEEKRAEAGFNPFELLINDKAYRKLEKKVEAERGPSLLAYLKSVGGLKDSGGELKSRDIRKGYPGLINNKKGLSLDDAALYAWEHGYLPSEADYSGEMGRPSIDTLLEAIDDEMRGDKHYSEQEESYAYKGLKEQLDWVDQLSHEMDLLGVDYSNMSVQEAEDAYKRASEEYMAAENADIDEAEEERRAIMEIDGAEYIPAAQNPTDEWDDIPFQSAYVSMRNELEGEYLDADRFEGTGEGNAAHGWGNYALKDRETNKAHYYDWMSEDRVYYDGVLVDRDTDEAIRYAAREFAYAKDVKEAKENIKEALYKAEVDIAEEEKHIKYLGETYGVSEKEINLLQELKDYEDSYYALSVLDKEKANEGEKEIFRQLSENARYQKDRFYMAFDNLDRAKRRMNGYKEALKVDLSKFTKKKTGAQYEVDVPEDKYLLDEDKTFNKQSKIVRDAINKIALSMDRRLNETKLRNLTGDKPRGTNEENWKTYYAKRAWRAGKDFVIEEIHNNHDGDMEQELIKFINDLNIEDISDVRSFDDYTGREIYRELDNHYGSQKAASKMLEKYGIKGIKYDGERDGIGYVIFKGADAPIMRRLLQSTKGTPKGAYTQADNIIHLFETADASTFMHETAHWFKRELRRFGTDRSRDMLKKVDAWENTEFAKRYKVELKDGYYVVTDTKGNTVYDNKFGTEKEAREYAKEELFARGFEQYLRTGKAPSSYLKEAFDAFMEWLKQIYRTVKSLDVDLNDEIEEVYATMVGGKELDNYVYGAQEMQATSKENAPAPQDDDVPFDMVYRDAVEEVKPTKQEVAEVVTTIKSAQDIAESIEPTTEEEQKGWWSGLYDIYNKVRTAVVGNEATAQSMEEYSEGWWSLFRRHFTDYLSGLEKIDADIYKRARVNAGLGGNIINALINRVQRLDKNGNIEDLGEGLMPILKDFRAEFGVSMAQTEKDLGDYMIARRYLEDLQNREDVKVTDKQIEESLNKVDALKKKYSAQVIRFKEYAERIYDYQKRISHFLVDSELMTEEKWQDMINKNPNYIPFYRILEDNGMQTDSFVRPVTSNGFNRSHPTIKKIKGSELDIRSPFASIVNNTTNVLRNAYKNNVARAVADLKDVYPNLVREKKPLMEHGKVKMKVSFDKGLRDALLNGIEQLGVKFTKAKTLNQKGERGLVLGDYNPQEKLVRERLGVDNALTHEFGHLLDFELGLGRWIIDSTTRKELEKLAEERLHYETQAVEDDNGDIRFERVLEQEPTPKFDAYIKNDREIIANLYDAYINAPEMLDKIAPKAKKKLEQALDKSGYKWLKDIKRTLDKGIEEIEQDAWVKSNVMPSGNTISYRQKGVKKYIEVHKKLYTALNGIDKSTRYPTIKAFFTIPEKILRLTTTTWSAAFTVRNMIRDTMEASINANVGFMPIISTLRGMYDVVTKSDVYKDWMASGGSFDSFMEVNENSERNPYEELFGNISKWKYINPLKWIEAFGNLGEQATRVSIYRLAKQKGRSDIDASILSRGSTVDFARGGDWAKVANQYSAFLNAGIQGTSAMLQAFKERPVQTTIKALAYITLPSILETGYYLYMAPDDDREEYLELPSWRKDLFWNFKVGDLWFMLPKPFTYGMVFGTIPQAMMIADYKNEDTDWKHLFEETLGTMNPLQDFGTYFPKLIKELIEQQLNKDFYTDRQIVPFFMEKRDPEFQYTDNTSDLAKEVGKIIGYSPAKIEHAVTSIFGTLSKDLMAAYDLWSNEDGVTKEWGELPVIRGFVNTQPIGNRSQSVQDYYDLYNDAFSAYTTYNSLKKESKDKAEEYAKENKERLNLYEHLKPYEKRRKDIAQEIKYIRNNDSMAPQAKKDAIDYLNKEMTANAREALKLKKDDAVLNETTEDRIKYNLWGTRNKVLADDSVIKEIARLNELEIRPTMTDPTETTKLSYLNNEQRKEARQKYADAYNAVVSQIIRTPEYRNAKDKEKKDMINKVRTHIVNLLKKEYKVK